MSHVTTSTRIHSPSTSSSRAGARAQILRLARLPLHASLVAALAALAPAQNYVPNGSFELGTGSPPLSVWSSMGTCSPTTWTSPVCLADWSPSRNTPDWIGSGGGGGNVPWNHVTSVPYDGSRFVFLLCQNEGDGSFDEGISVPLATPLTVGQTYHVCFAAAQRPRVITFGFVRGSVQVAVGVGSVDKVLFEQKIDESEGTWKFFDRTFTADLPYTYLRFEGEDGNSVVIDAVSLSVAGCAASFASTPPTCDAADHDVFIPVGQTFTTTFTGSDANGDFLTISAPNGLPGSSTLSPAPGTTLAAPVTTTFAWTPTVSDIGTHTINVKFEDPDGGVASCPVTVTVGYCGMPPRNMSAWWRFDADPAGTALDSASDHHAVLSGSPQPIVGLGLGALRFDGSGADVAFLTDPNRLKVGTGAFSIDAWIRTSYSGGLQAIVDKLPHQAVSTGSGYSLFLNATGRLTLAAVDAGIVHEYSGGPALNDGQWHLVASSYSPNSAEGVKLYVDGAAVTVGAPSTIGIGSLDGTGRFKMALGFQPGTSQRIALHGDLDEVEVFKHALKPSEVDALYKAFPSGKCQESLHISETLRCCGTPHFAPFLRIEIVNDSNESRAYHWEIVPGAVSLACPLDLSSGVFNSLQGDIVVPAGEHRVRVVGIICPSTVGRGCFEVQLSRVIGGVLTVVGTRSGVLDKTDASCWDSDLGVGTDVATLIPFGNPWPVGFGYTNTSEPFSDIYYRLEVRPLQAPFDVVPVILNGGAEGEPYTGWLQVPPGGSTSILCDVFLAEHDPWRSYAVSVMSDLNRDGLEERVASTIVRSSLQLPDDCSTPLDLSGPGPFAFDLTGATTGAEGQSDLACATAAGSALESDVWFNWTAEASGRATIDTCNSATATDTKIAVYSGSGCPAAPALACNDDTCGARSEASWDVVAGTVYTIQVGSSPGTLPGRGMFTIEVVPVSAGTPFCFGDGTGTACPCANFGSAGNGCANSVDSGGANLTATGSASLAVDTLVLAGTSMPNSSALYFQGTTQVSVAFGDGLRCAGGSVIRLGTKTNVGNSSQYPDAGDLSVSVKGLVSFAGGMRTYQCWYRNAAAFCTSSTFNLTNGYAVIWQP